MKIKSLHIISFGGLRNRDIDLSDGVNVIDGANESGKSSAAMFIKFIFYGLSAKNNKSTGSSERNKYVNKTTGQAAGFMIAETDDGETYRIERVLVTSDSSPTRERTRIINQSTGETVSGKNPGEYFFGVPEDVFVGTCFVSQQSAVKPSISDGGKSSSSSKNAIENLLTSADENIDVARAVKKLDNVRRELSHKIGNGGEIADLKAKRTALAAEEEDSIAKTKELLALSTSLDDIKKHIASLENSKEKYDRIFTCLEKINTVRKLDAIDDAESRISNLSDSLEQFDRSYMGREFSATLANAERDIVAYDKECIAYNDRLKEMSDETALPKNEIVEDANALDSSAKIQLSVATALFIGAAIAAVAAVLLYSLNTGLHTLPLITAAILVTVSLSFFVTEIRNKSRLKSLLEEWEAESVDDIERAVRDKINKDKYGITLTEEYRRMTASIDSSKQRFNMASQTISRLAKNACIKESAEIYDTVAALHELDEQSKASRAQMESKIQNLRGRVEIMREQLGNIDPGATRTEVSELLTTKDGSIANSLDEAGVKKFLHERQFTDNEFRAAAKRRSMLEEKLAALPKPAHTPEEIETTVALLDERIEELSRRRDALEMAGNALQSAGESMRSGVIPRISGNASRIIAVSTGKYSKMTLDKNFTCGLTDGDETVTSEHLSKGTSDLSYIALRIALADEVFKGEKPTVIFDESFAHIDSDRIKNVIRLLAVGQADNQYIVFTCREDETDAAKLLGCNTIKMRNPL